MANEIVETETQVQSTSISTLKEQKHADPKPVEETFHISSVPLLHGQQQSLGNAYASNINGPLHLLAPDHDSHAHDHEKHEHDHEKHKHDHENHKHDHEHKKVPDHPVAFEDYGSLMVGHSENMAAPSHQLNRM
ncbi:hypothetical protein EC968_000168 [Mortierella alpina]|nr:hypothetical protein EC968_000168 [Mortierella alpina]